MASILLFLSLVGGLILGLGLASLRSTPSRTSLRNGSPSWLDTPRGGRS